MMCYCLDVQFQGQRVKLALSTDRLAAQQHSRRQRQTIATRWKVSTLYGTAMQQLRLSGYSSSASHRKGPASIPWKLVWNLWFFTH